MNKVLAKKTLNPPDKKYQGQKTQFFWFKAGNFGRFEGLVRHRLPQFERRHNNLTPQTMENVMNNEQNMTQGTPTHKNAGNFANDRKRAAEATTLLGIG